MNKKVLWFSLGILCLTLIGCGQLTDQHTERVSALGDQISNQNGNNTNTGDNDEVLATNKITLTIGDPKASLSPQAITAKCLIASQSVNIVADVPGFLTFQACSDIFFNVTQLSKIEADGSIKLKIIYNDLLSKDIESIKVKACMLDANGLIGQKEPQSIIPLEVKVVDEKPYQDLNTNCAELKNWKAPFTQGINKVLTLKLKGDFTNALKQQYKGTILLKLVKEKKPECAVKWTLATNDPGWDSLHQSLDQQSSFVFMDKLWVINDTEGIVLELFYTKNGKDWSKGSTIPGSGDYDETVQTVVYNNKLWLINIGRVQDEDPQTEILIRTSCDGSSWKSLPTPNIDISKPARAVVFNNKIWLFDNQSAWNSIDGIHWNKVTGTLPWTEEFASIADCVVFADKVWVTDSTGRGNAWYSTDGINWTKAPTFPVGKLLAYCGKLWTIDEDGKVHYSLDGKVWTNYLSTAPWTDKIRAAYSGFDNKLWTIGGALVSQEVWYLCIK
ncbi:MAG TPA: hypothetical protein DCS13_00985 [Candidatus Margulisbacteria bacterium]|nr:MAG: hypothetical protein A2X43_06115 [Candidatus Margulisbacteria bacterium GWD2_39_127]HAR62019.1 hypothetical protein [Candidatus Margulisiibacteriota bacterium]